MTIAIGTQITTVVFSSTDGTSASSVPVTFGQAFGVGDLPAGSFLELKPSSGASVPCQLDAKAFHADGSIRHGVLSSIIPAIPSTGTVTYGIVRAASGPVGAALVPSNFTGLDATVTLSDNGTDVTGPTAGTVYTATATAALAGGTYTTHLSGPIASEWIIRAPLKDASGNEHPDLHARFSIRGYAGNTRAKIDYIIENSWAKPKATPSGSTPWENVSVNDHVYSFSLKAGTTTVHTRSTNGFLITNLTNNVDGAYDGLSTGLPNTSTVYTATMLVDGVSKNLSITGSAAQTFGSLRAAINTQLGGMATCSMDASALGLIFKSVTTGAGSMVSITNYGTLFPALGHSPHYRPIRGDEVVHYARTRWKKTFWWGAEPKVHVAHDKTYLIGTGALPNYAPDLVGDTNQITTDYNNLKANEDIGQNGITKAFMADTGYAPGIGLLPEWCAMYAVNQGQMAKYTMLKMADLAGSWPVIVREYNTDNPIDFAMWPYATFSPNAGDSVNSVTGLQEKLPVLTPAPALQPNRNIPEGAHVPDFYFVPYLVTGDHFYMEGMLFYQRWVTLGANPHATYRDGRKNLWKVEQTRGQAWEMRTAVHTAYLVPANHPLRNDVLYQIDQNVIWYNANYVSTSGQYNNQLGAFVDGQAFAYDMNGQSKNGISPWQDAFVTSACGRAVELGFTAFSSLLAFKSKFQVGLLTSGAAYCWQAATLYSMQLRDTSTSPVYTTFGQIYQATAPTAMKAAACGSQEMANEIAKNNGFATINSMAGYPTDIGGFPANLQPAVAYVATFATTGGTDAWTVFDNRVLKPNYNNGPQFAIVPRTTSLVTPASPPPPADPVPPTPPVTPPVTPPTTPSVPLGEKRMLTANRVQETTTATNTATVTLLGKSLGRRSFADGFSIGTTGIRAVIEDDAGNYLEGTWTLTSSTLLTRESITGSSAGGTTDVVFPAGSKRIYHDLLAADINKFASSADPAASAIANPATSTVLIEEGGITKRITAENLVKSIGVSAAQLTGITSIPDTYIVEVADPVSGTSYKVSWAAVRTSVQSGSVADNAAPSVPGSLASSNVTQTAATLTWTASTDNVGVAYYEVSKDGATWTNVGTALTYTYTTLTASTIYGMQVRASDAAGNRSTYASLSVTTAAVSGDTTAPSMSGSISTSSVTSSGFTMSYTAGTDNVGVTRYEVSVDGGTTWITNALNLSYVATGKTASTLYNLRVRCFDAAGLVSNVLTGSVTTAAAASEVLTVNTPSAQAAGTPFSVTGTYANATPTVLDYSLDGGTTWTAATSPTISGGNFSFSVTVSAANASQTVAVRDHNNTSASATSGSFAVTSATAYTITPYNSNAVNTTISAAAAGGGGGKKYLGPDVQSTNLYWFINATVGNAEPASAVSGWGTSSTVPPAILANANDNNGQVNNLNGMVPMGHPSAFGNGAYLWVPAGSGTTGPYFFWIKPVDGVAQCVSQKDGSGNFIGTMVTGA